METTEDGRFFRQLGLMHVQLDELETRLRDRASELWLWVAVDVPTKVIAVVEPGPRTQERAHRLIHRLKEMVTEGRIPVFTSVGLSGRLNTALAGSITRRAILAKLRFIFINNNPCR